MTPVTIGAALDLEIYQINFTTIFLNSKMKEDITWNNQKDLKYKETGSANSCLYTYNTQDDNIYLYLSSM